MKRIDTAALLLLALCLVGLFAHLASVPAMSLDEAWIGLFASRLRSVGFYTPHQMNHYTGPLYARLAAAFFDARGLSLESLRLPGALLNAAALLGLWAHLRRRISPEAAASWALLCASSAFFLMKSRLGWEVYALQPILILGTLAALARPGGAAALTALAILGVQNHFIYLSVPASLVVLFGTRAAWRGEKEAEDRLSVSAAALAAGATLALVKYPISNELWAAHRPALFAALILLPVMAAALIRRAPITLLMMPFTRLKRPLFAFFSLTILAFIIWHLAPLVQIFSGPVIFKRMFSCQLPGPLSVLLYAWGVFLAALLVWTSVRAWHDDNLGFHERTLLLWPAAFATVFILFRHTSSLRYYSLPALLCTIALAVLLPKIAAADRRGVYRCALAALFVTQAFLLPELAAPQDRRPLNFHIGWRKENSKDFSRKEGLFAAYAASGACQVAHAERSFTAIPLFFHRAEVGDAPCDAALAFDSDQCPECASAPFYRWSVVPATK